MRIRNPFVLLRRGEKSRSDADGSGTERGSWRNFTISQSSDVYEQNFAYTVRYDEASDSARLCTDIYDRRAGYPVEKGIRLKRKTLHALFALDIPSFPDAVPNPLQADLLDGTFLCCYFTDRNGRVSKKSVPRGMEKELLSLIVPYARRLKGK